ncbi:MAG: hypothetical protein HYZ26_09275 [Chloroflexi bacterium]|nr:hypothetical protein [Chloroflexota bacterium]
MSVTRIQLVVSNEVPEPREIKTPPRALEANGTCDDPKSRRLTKCPPATVIA